MKIIHRVKLFLPLFVSLEVMSCAGSFQQSSENICKRCESLKRVSSRIECYTDQIKKDSGNAGLYLRRARHYVEFMKYRPALDDYLMAYEFMPEKNSIAANIACMYARIGIADKAAQWFSRSENNACSECISQKRNIIEECLEECNQFNTMVLDEM